MGVCRGRTTAVSHPAGRAVSRLDRGKVPGKNSDGFPAMATKLSSHRQTPLPSLSAVPGQPSGPHRAVLALGFLPTADCPQGAWVGLSGQADCAQEFPTPS